jgi:hypothetical protein
MKKRLSRQGKKLQLLESFTARGHENITGTHKSTLEFTKDPDLTPRGDCIIGVKTSIAPAEFSARTKRLIRTTGNRFILVIQVGHDLIEKVEGEGHVKLELKNEQEMVFRKSNFTCGRTVLINCDKAAIDLKEKFRKKLTNYKNTITIKLFLAE